MPRLVGALAFLWERCLWALHFLVQKALPLFPLKQRGSSGTLLKNGSQIGTSTMALWYYFALTSAG
jgi:hypothetical protein